MEQVSRHVPIMWYYGCTGEAKLPLTIFGAQWVNVSVSTTVALVAPPIDDPYGFNSSYGTVKPQAAGASLTGEQCCTADGPPLDCTWANTSATVAVRVGGGAPSWMKTGYGYFFTVSVTGAWQLMASGASEAGSETNVKVRILVSGHLASGFGLQTWHNISLAAAGCELKAEVDGVVVASATDVGCNATQAGYAAVGSGWHAAQVKEVWAHDSTPNY